MLITTNGAELLTPQTASIETQFAPALAEELGGERVCGHASLIGSGRLSATDCLFSRNDHDGILITALAALASAPLLAQAPQGWRERIDRSTSADRTRQVRSSSSRWAAASM
jgi:hypothetical protein